MSALDYDIIEYDEYLSCYNCIDDDIRNKRTITLISCFYIVPFLKLSQLLSNCYTFNNRIEIGKF